MLVEDPFALYSSIGRVVLWGNGMVMVFDKFGQQMPDYQGWYNDVRGKIMKDAPVWATFWHGVWNESMTQVDRGTW